MTELRLLAPVDFDIQIFKADECVLSGALRYYI
jgi:hypothetical protein